MSCSCCHNEKHETKNCEHKEHNHNHHQEEKQTSSCGCGHCHHHEDETSKNTMILKIILSSIFLVLAITLNHFFDLPILGKLGLFIVPYLIIGFSVIREAVENIFHGEFFDENFLMTVATIGAFAIGEYPEAVLVMLLSQIGETFESMASAKARKSISSMMDIKPDFAHLVIGETTKTVNPEEVKIGDIILVKPGEKIPLDGVIEKGESTLDTSALTGESLPRTVSKDNEVVSGAVNLTSLLYVRVTKIFSESTVSKILDLVENAENKKAKAENFITKFAKYYTPIVVFAALALAIIPSLIFGDWGNWIKRACIFLVVSCPCALVISVPLSFFAGIGAASKRGILIKGGNFIETLAKMEITVFDKTGTLTKGNFEVVKVFALNQNENELLNLAAKAESFSNHPIGKSILKAAKIQNPSEIQKNVSIKEISGMGIEATLEDEQNITIFCGNQKLLKKHNIQFEEAKEIGTIVYVAKNQDFLGYIVIADAEKPEATSALTNLKALGIERTVMLTGDQENVANAVGKKLGVDTVFANLLPQDKVSILEQLLAEKKIVGFVGDGINDAPVLTRSDVGIAMGGLGSDAAIEAADVVLMDDNPEKIAVGIKIARNTLKIVKENIAFALGIKLIVLLAGSLGLAPMWLAIFADVGVSVIAILNAMRAGGKQS
ncbi:MAG: cadmium-translocating P-type ATPase [Spirochaetaceae bacterium]|nr:cadmium-translocating P-type ATPase [Spirochaetaceae bacterium]